MKKYVLLINLFVILIALLYGVLSGSIGYNFNKKQEGERFYIALNIMFKNEMVSQNIGFRYSDLKFFLKGKIEDYRNFVLNRGYIEVNKDIYCKDGNLITMYTYTSNIELKYEYDSKQCKFN
ncbi:hypothetical protein [Rodentibacter heidelbergensis]|uniref:Uncharacterized protein n=1 Tax=Rodentibacter heidelbergensis TaxID=1908258 RepID=A0A1V3ICL8_9PAST|nr:hypothetical protein [Rodentibacter heidelbergensis]OOF37656.1 hypothetical protein BKK48_01640 [Rodentibacter heidelbergensis]